MTELLPADGRLGARLRVAWLGLWLFPIMAAAISPGDILFARPKMPRAQGHIAASFAAPDGSVFLRGDFTAVNGTSRPGLVKLTATGEVDPGFWPGAVDVSGTPWEGAIYPYYSTSPYPGSQFDLCGDGTVLYSASQDFLAYRSTGSLDSRFDALREETGLIGPLFETGGNLYVGRTPFLSTGRLHAYRSGTLEPVPLDIQDSWPAPFVQAAPAGSDRLWILGGVTAGLEIWYSSTPHTLFRVEANGEMDTSFTPVALSGWESYTLKPRLGGGFRLVHVNRTGWMFWPSPKDVLYVVDSYDAQGQAVASRRIQLPMGVPLVEAEEADGSLLHNVVESVPTAGGEETRVNVWVRSRPDGTRDPDFRVPLQAFSLQVLADGRIHHSLIHRILPDGTPDPSWRVPQVETDPNITILGRFADGGMVVIENGGTFSPEDPPLMVLDSDLQPEASFRPPADLPPVHSYSLSADHRSLVVALRNAYKFSDGSYSKLIRLLRDGSIDPDSPRFIPSTGPSFVIGTNMAMTEMRLMSPSGPFNVIPLSGDKFLVYFIVDRGDVNEQIVQRILPDGSIDPTFGYSGETYRIDSFFVLSDDRFLSGGKLYSADGALERDLEFPLYGAPLLELSDGRLLVRYSDGDAQQLAQWDLVSGRDPSFQTAFRDGTRISRGVQANAGDIVVEGSLVTATGTETMLRLLEDGQVEPAFHLPAIARTVHWSLWLRRVMKDGVIVPATFANRSRTVGISAMQVVPEKNALLLSGSFTHIGQRSRRGLALISLTHIPPDIEWLVNLLRELFPWLLDDFRLPVDLDPNTPRMGVGAFDRDRGLEGVPENSRQFQFQINPDVDEVDFVVEVSDNLIEWRTAQQHEIAVTQEGRKISVQFLGGDPALFVRINYRQVAQ